MLSIQGLWNNILGLDLNNDIAPYPIIHSMILFILIPL